MARAAAHRRLPDGFLVGCASAAHQVEGGLDNDWTEMERGRPGAIRDDSVSGVACDHYGRYREDLAAVAALSNNAHRFSVEWSRIEPEEGLVDGAALRHYVDVVARCRELGMEPVVTLLHFTLPRWLADRGGVLAPDAPRCFARFAAMVYQTLGHDVNWWVTINEPSVHASMAYLFGAFPPNHQNLLETRAASTALLRMHAAASIAIRRGARRHGHHPMLTVAHHERRIRPHRSASPLDRMVALMPDYLFNRWFLRSCQRGRLLAPMGWGEVIPGLRGSLDYIGLNYYCEDSVRFSLSSPQTLFGMQTPVAGLPLTHFGNTIDPAGLRRALDSLWGEFGLPIMVTENGIATEDDSQRAEYIVDHLNAILDAAEGGVDVRGYLHWTQMDNFEWAMGYSEHFGLFSVDRETLERSPRPSAAVFGELAATGIVPRSLADAH